MPDRRDLPPPPKNPVLSPPVTVAGEESVTVAGLPGEPSLEARVRAGADDARVVLLCHPHPLYGGTMHSAVLVALAKVIAEEGGGRVGWLRFNFRGVGASGGEHGGGAGEVRDAQAALRDLRRRAPNAEVSVCGYSFGSWVAAHAVLEGRVDRVALVAPAVRIFDFLGEGARAASRVAIFVGDADEFCTPAEAEGLAKTLGARLQVFPGNDHFFLASRRKLAEAVVPFLLGEDG